MSSVPVVELHRGLPPPATVPLDALRGMLVRGERRIVVLDDDPTGTQTVRDAPVVTDWSVESLHWALAQASPIAFVLTNSRAMSERDAVGVAGDVARNALIAARQHGIEVTFASRGDSTLRGHFPGEVDAVGAVLAAQGEAADAVVVVPAYVEAGRLTRDGTHYVVADGVATPVGETEFARDATFGYRSSNLVEWVEERTGGRWGRDDVTVLAAADLRVDGGAAAVGRLLAVGGGRPVVVDAVDAADLDVLARGLTAAAEAGRRVLVRCGPSFVRSLGGLPASTPLRVDELGAAMDARSAPHGLVVVGSHTGLTTRQMRRALGDGGYAAEVELDVAAVLSGATTEAVTRAVDALVDGAPRGDVLLRTSRDLVRGDDPEESLRIAGRAAAALVDVVRRTVAAAGPRWVVAKGGITSSDVAVRALGIDRGWVLGQMLPGMVPVWVRSRSGTLGAQGAMEASSGGGGEARPLCVIFPGNVGDDAALADVVRRLRAASAGGPVERPAVSSAPGQADR